MSTITLAPIMSAKATQRRQYQAPPSPTFGDDRSGGYINLLNVVEEIPRPLSPNFLQNPPSRRLSSASNDHWNDEEGPKLRTRWRNQLRALFRRSTTVYGIKIRFLGFIILATLCCISYLSRSSSPHERSKLSSTWERGRSVASSVGLAKAQRSAVEKPEKRKRVKRASDRVALPAAVEDYQLPDHSSSVGLLKVDGGLPVEAHPIYQLIRDARDAWDEKNERQSKTLYQATMEYRRRYGRPPPKGFDKWWRYVVENNVQLPDEYDQINNDISLFRALSPADLAARVRKAMHMPDTCILKVVKGSLRVGGTYRGEEIPGADERLAGQADLLSPIVQYLDDMSVVYSVHDTPNGILGFDHRMEILDRIGDGEYVDTLQEIDLSVKGWAAACPPKSPLRMSSHGQYSANNGTSTIQNKRFIKDHEETMDLCNHPDSVSLHGFTSGKDPRVQDLVPIFALSKTKLHSDVLGVPVEQWSDMTEHEHIPWAAKERNELHWRGSNTGSYFSTQNPWQESHRTRLVALADAIEGEVSVLPSPKNVEGKKTLKDAIVTHSREQLNEDLMDIGFSGVPIQCDHEDGTCTEIQDSYSFLPSLTVEEAQQYKYVFDVDGNAWSARFSRLLSSGSLIFKSTIMPEWWTQRIQPWVHYIPIQVDYSDLYDALVFFRGDGSAERSGEEALAEEIAEAGRKWAHNNYRKVDMTAYVFRLYLEWARLTASDRSSMDFVYRASMEVKQTEGSQ